MDYSEEVKMRLFNKTLRSISSLAFNTLITIGVRDCDSFLYTDIINKLKGLYSSELIFELLKAQNRFFDDCKKELPSGEARARIQKIQRKSSFELFFPGPNLPKNPRPYFNKPEKTFFKITPANPEDMAFYEIPPKTSILRKPLPFVFFAQDDIEGLWDTSQFTRMLLKDMFLLSSDQWQKLNATCIYPEDPAETLLSICVGFWISKNLGQDIFLEVINALRTLAQDRHKKFNENGPSIVQDKPFASEVEIKQIKHYKFDSFKLPGQVLSLCERYNIKYWGELANISEKDIMESDGFVFGSLEKISFFWNLTPFVDVAKKEIDTWEEENFLSFSVMINNYIGSIIEDNRNQYIVMARLGLINGRKQTLQQIGEEIQVTGERIRQIESKCLKKLKNLKNLKKLNRFWYAIEEILRLNKGVCSLSNLSKLLTNKMQWSNEPESSAVTELAILYGRFQLEKENNLLSDPNHRCLKCVLVREAVELEIKNNKKEITFEEARVIINRVCDQKDECRIDVNKTRCVDDFIIYLNEHSDYLKIKDDIIYSDEVWSGRFGSRIQIAEKILKEYGRPVHIKELYVKFKGLFPDDEFISERNVHAYFTRENSNSILLWDRGTYVHRDCVSINMDLINRIEYWIINKLNEGAPFISVFGAFIFFKEECLENEIPFESALYTCLRLSSNPELRFPKYPQIYLSKDFESRIPNAIAIEQYIQGNNHFVTLSELKDFALNSLMLKESQYQQIISGLSEDFLIGNKGVIVAKNFEGDQEQIMEIYKFLHSFVCRNGHVSIEKIYNDKRVTCVSLGIEDPKFLYNLLKPKSTGLSFDKYPVVSWIGEEKINMTISGQVERYLENKQTACSYDELEKALMGIHGYSERTLYAALQREDILRYGQGSFIHINSIEWSSQKRDILMEQAGICLDQANKINCPYGLVSELIEYSDLPKMPDNILWTETLLGEILVFTGFFRVLGNARNVFVPKKNDEGIHVFEDLVYVILKNDFGGAENINKLGKVLKELQIVNNRVTPSMLGNQKKVCVCGDVIMLRELSPDA